MAEAPVHKSQYRGELIQCAKCGRVVGADQVNERKRCDICSPPHAAKDEPDEAPATE